MTVVVVAVAAHATCARCAEGGGAAIDDAAAVSASAGAGAGQGRVGSCDRVPTMSMCSEYSGGYLAQNEAVLTSVCGKLSGTFVYAECPNTAVLGSCALSTGEVRRFYASGAQPYDAARAQSECEGSYRGTWAAFR